MLNKTDVLKIIAGCRKEGIAGVSTGKATINDLTVDFLNPPFDFLGVHKNPAIFINQDTFNLLGRFHPTWVANSIIAVKSSFLETETMRIIGILVHETGHAFNVAAKITNSEANAYIFEIEVLSRWLETNDPLLLGCNAEDLQKYFESRLPNYRMDAENNQHLSELIRSIEDKMARSTKSKFISPSVTDITGTFFCKPKPITFTPSCCSIQLSLINFGPIVKRLRPYVQDDVDEDQFEFESADTIKRRKMACFLL